MSSYYSHIFFASLPRVQGLPVSNEDEIILYSSMKHKCRAKREIVRTRVTTARHHKVAQTPVSQLYATFTTGEKLKCEYVNVTTGNKSLLDYGSGNKAVRTQVSFPFHGQGTARRQK